MIRILFKIILYIIIAILVLWLIWYVSGGLKNLREDYVFGGPIRTDSEHFSYLGTFGNHAGGDTPNTTLNAEPSRLDGTVFIDGDTRGARNSSADSEYILLDVNHTRSGAINISGWTLRDNKGNVLQIGKASRVPYQGRVNDAQDVIVSPGDTVVVHTGTSPIGVSFKENICTGFLTQYQRFTPQIKHDSCPGFTSYGEMPPEKACRDYIASLPSCKIKINDFPDEISETCKIFIENTYNYNSCVDIFKNSSNFEKNTWQLFAGKDTEFWKSDRGFIYLFDKEGKLVDTATY